MTTVRVRVQVEARTQWIAQHSKRSKSEGKPKPRRGAAVAVEPTVTLLVHVRQRSEPGMQAKGKGMMKTGRLLKVAEQRRICRSELLEFDHCVHNYLGG